MQPYHTGVWGDSGGGKTTFLREMHAEFPHVSILVNHSGEHGFTGHRAGTQEKAIKIIREHGWDSKIVWESAKDPKDQVREVRQLCHRIWDYAGVPQQVIVDEAYVLLPDYKSESGPGADNPLRDMLHGDRDKGTKVVISAQDPSDMFYPPVKQLEYHVWCGRPSGFHEGFMNYFKFPKRELSQLDKFEYAVMTGKMSRVDEETGDIPPKEIIYRGRTKEKYA